MTETEYLSMSETADYLGIKYDTLAKWRSGVIKGPKIPFHRIGRRVFYKRVDLQSYIESTRVDNEGEA